MTGASTAISRPAPASAQPSCASTVPSGPKLELVRYTVNTNVVTTALKAAEPQSHSPHASTTRLRVLEGPSAPTALASASVGVMPGELRQVRRHSRNVGIASLGHAGALR